MAATQSGSSPGVLGSLPESFGPYRIVERLGQGGMGTVYLAHDSRLDRKVALKVCNQSEPQMLERFQREAKAAAALQHANLCPVHEVGVINGIHYLTMAFIDGPTLAEWSSDKPRSQREAAAMVAKLALAMQEAHARGVIHRDLKPANIKLNARVEPVILDFGLARRMDRADVRLTQSGGIVGTPAYMAPEQVSEEVAAIGPGCDIYALGVILYELLTGRLPFEGPAALVLGLIMVQPPERPSRWCSNLDGRLEAICLKALAKKPAERYATMTEMAKALASYVRGSRPSGAQPVAKALPATAAHAQPAAKAASGMDTRAQVLAAQTQIPQGKPAGPPPARKAPVKEEPAARSVWPLLVGGGCGVVVLGLVLVIAVVLGSRSQPSASSKLADRDKDKGAVPDRDKDKGAVPDQDKDKSKLPPAIKPVLAKEVENAIGMKLVLIPAGTFWMGSPKEEKDRFDNEEQHEVEITEPFYLGMYEVTQAQYERVMNKNPARFHAGAGGGPNHPVETVSWEEAKAFCDALTNLAEEKLSGRKYRLPTEAEWEYTCREGARLKNTKPFHFGDKLSSDLANFDGNFPYGGAPKGDDKQKTMPVGSYKPNAFGLYDLHGNVWEWCADWYDAKYYSNSPKTNPKGPETSPANRRVLRGGSWSIYGWICRAAYRNRNEPGYRNDNYGFRVVLDAGARTP